MSFKPGPPVHCSNYSLTKISEIVSDIVGSTDSLRLAIATWTFVYQLQVSVVKKEAFYECTSGLCFHIISLLIISPGKMKA